MRFIALFLLFLVFLVIPAQGDDEKAKKIERVWSQDYTKRKGVWFHCKKYPKEHEQCLLGAWDHKFRIINDSKSPVQITRAKLFYLGKPYFDRYSQKPSYIFRLTSDGGNVAAVRYGVMLYDSFRGNIGSMSLVDLYFKELKEAEWAYYIQPAVSFELFGVGCLFVRHARLKDGRIWEMNVKRIAAMMLKRGCGTRNQKDMENAVRKQGKSTLRL